MPDEIFELRMKIVFFSVIFFGLHEKCQMKFFWGYMNFFFSLSCLECSQNSLPGYNNKTKYASQNHEIPQLFFLSFHKKKIKKY